jgi:3-oxoacyl-[acyl-carrier-protein] synthase III
MFNRGVTISGFGTSVPDLVHSNQVIENNAPTTAKWIEEKLGIHERRIVINETVSDLGTQAALAAMKSANLNEEDIDMIVVATSSPERLSPSTACTIHRKLNFKKNIPCFDINAVCAGFVFAMHLCAPMISTKMYKNILIVGTEVYSKITDWKNRNCVFFGDGSGALILSASEKGWTYSEVHSDGSGTGFTGFNCSLEGTYNTNPQEVWDAAVTLLPESIKSVLRGANLEVSDISMFFPHQASINMIKTISTDVGLEHKKIKKVMNKYGNIAGASIPIALGDAFENKEIMKGDKLLLTAIGSGWSWGSMVINYE